MQVTTLMRSENMQGTTLMRNIIDQQKRSETFLLINYTSHQNE